MDPTSNFKKSKKKFWLTYLIKFHLWTWAFFYNLSPSSFILPFLHVSPSLNATHWHFCLLGKYSNCDKLQRNSLFVRSHLLRSLKICIWNYMTKCDSIYADIPMQLYIKIARQKERGGGFLLHKRGKKTKSKGNCKFLGKTTATFILCLISLY